MPLLSKHFHAVAVSNKDKYVVHIYKMETKLLLFAILVSNNNDYVENINKMETKLIAFAIHGIELDVNPKL